MNKLKVTEKLIMMFMNNSDKSEFTIKELSIALDIHVHNIRMYVYSLSDKKLISLLKFRKNLVIVKK